MLSMQKLGFWKERGYADGTSIFDLIEKNNNVLPKVIDYLSKGHLIAFSLGTVSCLVNEEDGIIGSNSILSDGKWFWTKEVKHYYENHGLEIPEEFIANVKKNNFKVPYLTEQEILKLSNLLIRK